MQKLVGAVAWLRKNIDDAEKWLRSDAAKRWFKKMSGLNKDSPGKGVAFDDNVTLFDGNVPFFEDNIPFFGDHDIPFVEDNDIPFGDDIPFDDDIPF